MSYITVQNVRDADPTGQGYSGIPDADIQAKIDEWQEFFETHTGQFFEEREIEITLDGSGGRILHLPIPIIELEILKRNDSDETEDLSTVAVYNGRGQPRDDRRNPKIALTSDLGETIWTRSYDGNGFRRFRRGRLNQYLKGKFGFTEADGSTPLRVQRAVLKLVVRDLESDSIFDSPIAPGFVTKEVTDGHSISWGGGGTQVISITGDTEIDQIISDFKAPNYIGVTSPAEY